MKYSSTRGGVRGLTFEDALLSGFVGDGGILLPDEIPQLSRDTLTAWSKLSYKDLVKEIAALYIPEAEIPTNELNALLDRAFSRFSHPDVVYTKRLKDELNVLELFHGVTMAFKDLALSCVGQFLEYFLEKRKKHVTMVVGTSGDTGSAAIEAVRGLKWVDIIVLLPRGRTSHIQELQMTTVIEDNVHVFRVDGTSDDLDAPIKQCFLDTEFVKKHSLSSINSINWARILVQIGHYFYAYFQVCPDCVGEAEIVVPTGACGNVTGGCIAYQMGLPIRLVCAVTENDIVARTVREGDFSMADRVIPSLAPSMDIQFPYNVERILHLFTGRNSATVDQFMKEFEKEGKLKIPSELLNKIGNVISSFTVDDEGIKATMRRCWRENDYLLCPHSAIGVAYHYHCVDSGTKSSKRVCIATASPAKFEEAVNAAGLTPQPTKEIQSLASKPTKSVDMNQSDDWEKMLREKVVDISEGLSNV